MRNTIAALFNSQLDFIFFFYGLAFILLGTICFSIARNGKLGIPWAVLGSFSYAHGAAEWLDLSALTVGDTPAFALARTALATGSFVLLTEFFRLDAPRFGLRVPGRWLYLPLLSLVVLAGAMGGLNSAGAAGRYLFGLVGAMGTAWVFARHATAYATPVRRLGLLACAGFALYGIAAGAIVPAAPFWPATIVNQSRFLELTGVPIQLVRGTLACWIAFSIWSIWRYRLELEVSSEHYTTHLRRQFVVTMLALAAIFACGWTLTNFLGGMYREGVQAQARSDIDLLAGRLAGETAVIESMVKALAGSPALVPLLNGGSRQDAEAARSALDLDVDASGATLGLILDASGTVVASSDRRGLADTGAPSYAMQANFQKSIAGEAGRYFAFDSVSGTQNYQASYPIRAGNGKIVGVAVLEKSLAALQADLRRFDRPYFLINPDGIIMMTNRLGMLLRPLWPLSADRKSELIRQFGRLDDRPVLNSEVLEDTWTTVAGESNYVRRRLAGDGRLSLVILNPTREMFGTRVLGIVVTLLLTLMTLIYLFGRERRLHDSVQMEQRLRLQELARDLGHQATTDPLTGLYNRLKFNETLASEILRSRRYGKPFCLVLFDIDHFKRINDSHGHQIGDNVLVQLSRHVAGQIRNNDLLARWGGEEFVILMPESGIQSAGLLAESLRIAVRQLVFDEAMLVTASFGVAEFGHADTAETLIARADEALYRAKVNGRDRVEVASQRPVSDLGLASVA